MNTITNTEQSISAVQLIEKKVNRILRAFIATCIIGIVFQLFLIFIRIFNIATYQVTGLHQALKDANFFFRTLWLLFRHTVGCPDFYYSGYNSNDYDQYTGKKVSKQVAVRNSQHPVHDSDYQSLFYSRISLGHLFFDFFDEIRC